MHLPADTRFKIGLAHAGASITLTSVTNAFSFFVGSFTGIPAIHSFCIFAGISVLTMYFSMLTMFSPWFIEDIRRLHRRESDCFGLFCCEEINIVNIWYLYWWLLPILASGGFLSNFSAILTFHTYLEWLPVTAGNNETLSTRVWSLSRSNLPASSQL